MTKSEEAVLKRITFLFPTPIRNIIKTVFLRIRFIYNRYLYVEHGPYTYLGIGFRLNCSSSCRVKIGRETHAEEFNVWEARSGSITVGARCFFGLRNVIMGPVTIGDDVSTGPFVCVLGPRHATSGFVSESDTQTVIGHNVWISTGAIIHFGISIGDSAVIGPGAVVTKDVPAAAYVAGNPARDITKLSGLEESLRKRSKDYAACQREAPETNKTHPPPSTAPVAEV